MDVGDWLEDLGMAQFEDAFVTNGIEAGMLRELSNEDLKDLGVAKLADRKRLLKAIADLNVGDAPGTSMLHSAVAPEGERRQVTALFADMASYTRLTSELGAEEIHAVLNRFFATIDAGVVSHGGVVDKHIGDNVMAVFGAPIAHDDDTMRAVRAALDIHERMAALSKECGRLLQAHIGIASGQVVASSTGSDSHRQYTVIGDSVNLAARLQDKAQPGETLISEALRHAVVDRIQCDSLGEIDVKGIDAPVRAWRVTGLRAADAPFSRVPFVGRSAELAQFIGMAEACRATGRGQAIVVRGEAGIGKTRLVDEFKRAAINKGFAAHRGLVLDFGAGEGRDAIRSVVCSLLGIHVAGDKAAHQVAAEAAARKGLVVEQQRIFLADLLNLPQSPEDRTIYGAMTNAVRNEGKRKLLGDLLHHASESGPIVVIIEDIHWADSVTLAHLAKLAATVAECPAILVMTSRVEDYPLDETWRGATGGCPLATLDVGPLRKEDAVVLASGFIDANNQLTLSCVERAAGNPLFLEHLLRNLEERGGEDIPASIQSIVLARIDRLPPADKQALQAASVLGQRFSLDALRHLTKSAGYSCAGLVQRHLIRWEGEDYLFAHALVQEGVYNSLLKARRQVLHRDAAAWYAEHDPVLRAEHLNRANDPNAAGAYLDAAKAQIATFHFETALSLADRGIELASDPQTRCETMCLRGDALRDMGATGESIVAFEKALDAAEDDIRQCRAWIGLAAGLRIADRQKAALEALENAEAAAIRHGLTPERVQIHYLRGNVYFPLGDIDGCLAEHEKALVLARETGATEGEALALGGLGDAYYLRGHMRTACEQFRACIAICRDHGYGRVEVANRHMVGWTRVYLMEFEEAFEDALAAAKMADTVGHRRAKLLGLMLAGEIEFALGRFDEMRRHLELALDLAQTIGASNFEAQCLGYLALLAAEQGRMHAARDLADAAVKVVREVGMTFFGPRTLAIKSALTEDRDAGKKLLAEAESILDSGCVSHNHFWFARTAIDHALAIGDWDEAERQARRLEVYTRDQPLPWSDFLIARGRALAAWGRGMRGEAVMGEVRRLRDLAVQKGLMPLAAKLERALAEV
jgi:class 3 adenylate cyclase/tetratricopeptide (TPR) repeat protein